MFQAILAKIPPLAPIVTITIAAILITLAAPAYADGHHDEQGPFWFSGAGWTQLHELASFNKEIDPVANLARAQDLLSRGANPNVFESIGITPLMVAASTNFVKMASLLIANGAFVNARDGEGRTAMDWAISAGHTQMQSLLRAHGGECNVRCK